MKESVSSKDPKTQVVQKVEANQGELSSSSQFIDNRPEALIQTKLHSLANNSSQVKEAAQLTKRVNQQSSSTSPIQRVKWDKRTIPKPKVADYLKGFIIEKIPSGYSNPAVLDVVKKAIKHPVGRPKKSFSWAELNRTLIAYPSFLEKLLDEHFGTTEGGEEGYTEDSRFNVSIAEKEKAPAEKEWVPEATSPFSEAEHQQAAGVHAFVRNYLGYPVNRELDTEKKGYAVNVSGFIGSSANEKGLKKADLDKFNETNDVAKAYLKSCLDSLSLELFKGDFDSQSGHRRLLVQALIAKEVRLGVCDTFGAFTAMILRSLVPDADIKVISSSGHTYAVINSQKVDPWDEDVHKKQWIKADEADGIAESTKAPSSKEYDNFYQEAGPRAKAICIMEKKKLTAHDKDLMATREKLIRDHGIGNEVFRTFNRGEIDPHFR